jgi:hypothetical protein
MKLFKYDGTTQVDFDQAEEEGFARLVYTLILLPSIAQEHSDFLIQIYQRRGIGITCLIEDVLRVLEIAEFYETRGADLPIPKIPRSNKGLGFFMENYSAKKFNLESRKIRAMIWLEQYNEFPQLQNWGEFRPFVGDGFLSRVDSTRQKNETYDGKLQMDLEQAFYEEVIRVKKEFECSFDEAEVLVSDYMHHGVDADGRPILNYRGQIFPLNDLTDRLDLLFATSDKT